MQLAPITFDPQGNITAGLDTLNTNVTDLLILCHGFRNDEADARALYTEFLANLEPQLTDPRFGLANRTFAAAGALWPSMLFKEPTDAPNARSHSDDTRLAQLASDLPANQAEHIRTILAHLPTAEHSEQAREVMAEALL